MTKASEIIQAWKNFAKPTEEMKEIAIERMEVCNGCSSRERNKLLNFDYCSICTCPLLGKIHSPINSCDLKKWNR
jgi:hypothetical protein